MPGDPPVWFVYYRVTRADLPQAVAAVRQGQRALAERHPGLSTELMQRPASDTPDQLTLLEVYRPAASPASLAGLPEEIERQMTNALAPWLRGPRRVEAFEPCA